MPFAVALLLSQVATELSTDVDVRPLGSGRHELTLTITGTNEPSVAHQLVPTVAARVCGSGNPVLGRYRFEGQTPAAGSPEPAAPTVLRFIQEIECLASGAAIAPSEAGVPAAPAEPPSSDDEATIRTLTSAYLQAKDEGDFQRARSMLAPATSAMMTRPSWEAPRLEFNAAAGNPDRREVIRVTWYDDPQGAPTPGRYAAADFAASYDSGAFYCGYVMWLRQQDGTYLVVREEEGQLDPQSRKGLTDAALPSVRVQMGCRD